MLTFLPSNRLQSFLNDGKVNANGYLQFYELGTTTPKIVYADVNGNAVKTNPVQLDSAGSSECYLKGSYTIVSYDRNMVQINNAIDVLGGINDFISSGGSGGFADNLIVSYNTYNDVRAITNPYSVIFVQGRELNADGGHGFFYFDSASTLSDDDGIVLTPSTSFGRYIRLNVTNIDPQWFGLQYDSILDQSAYIAKAEYSASQFSKPVIFTGNVYINSNYTTSSSQFILSDSSKIVSTLSVNFTFTSGSSISYMGRRIFGNSVQPIFQRGSTDFIRYSWMDADENTGRWQKFLNASQIETTYILDEDLEIGSNIIIPNNSKFIFENASRINLTSGTPYNISIPKLNDPELITSAIYFPTSASIGSINLNNQLITPKFFCGIGSTVTSATSGQDFTSFHAALKSGKFYIDDVYNLYAKHIIPNSVEIVSNCSPYISAIGVSGQNRIEFKTSGTLLSATSNISFKNVAISMISGTSIFSDNKSLYDGCVVYSPNDYGFLITNGTQEIRNTRLGEHISTLEILNNVTYENVIKESDPSKIFYRNNTQFKNVYLENEQTSHTYDNILVTSGSTGYVYGKSTLYVDTISANTTTFGIQKLDVSNTTKIQFNNDMVYRNGVFQYQANTYTTTTADQPIIEVEVINTTADRLILTSGNPQFGNMMTIVVKTTGSQVLIGDNVGSTSYTWNPANNIRVPNPTTDGGKMCVQCFFVGGKWAIC